LTLQEAKVSSNVENIVTTNDDLYIGATYGSYKAEAKEVANYKDALFIGYEKLKDKGIISLSDIEEINKPVNKKMHQIRTNLPNFKSDLTKIANVKANGEIEILYTPPHGKELLQKLLIDMLDFVYDDEAYLTHPLIKIALAHYQFESIHPFRDGNGRTGRILNILFLCQKEYLCYPILYASSYIIQNKNEYYSLLQECKETQKYTDVIEYMLTSFKTTAEKTLHIVEEIKSMLVKYSSDEFLDGLKGQKTLLIEIIEIIFKKVYVRNADLVEMGVHRQTAATYLDQLVDKGLLAKEKVGRDNIYKNVKLLELFEGEYTDEQ
ncbi:MAG: Fic family protein, partial [Sedimentibacter sp.]